MAESRPQRAAPESSEPAHRSPRSQDGVTAAAQPSPPPRNGADTRESARTDGSATQPIPSIESAPTQSLLPIKPSTQEEPTATEAPSPIKPPRDQEAPAAE